MKTLTTDLFPKFYKGFQHFANLRVTDTSMIFTTGAKVHSACDAARKRIFELQLPLEAKVTGYNEFIVTPLVEEAA